MRMNKFKINGFIIVGILFLLCACKQVKKEGKETKNAEKVKLTSVIDLSMMDTSIKPQDDFYHFANGGWEKRVNIPLDKSDWGSFYELIEKNDSITLNILKEIINTKNLRSGTESQKISYLYASVMDTVARNKEGIKPIQPHLEEIDAIKNKAELIKYFAKAKKEGYASLLGFYVRADNNNSAYNTLFLNRADMGLDKDYYQKDDAKDKVEKYKVFVGNMLQNLGKSKAEAQAEAVKIVAFEKILAKAQLSRVKDQDTELTNNPYKVTELKKLMPSINWVDYFRNAGLSNADGLIVSDVQYYKNLERILKETPLETIKSYLKWMDFNLAADKLSMDLERQKFAFYGTTLLGTKKMRPLKKKALSVVNNNLGEAIGKIYVAKVFPPEAKAKAEEMIDYLFKSYKKHFKELTWMSQKTKEKALEKLNKITRKIGYPDKWKDYTTMEIVSVKEGGSYYQNVRNSEVWRIKDNISKYGKKVDKEIWYIHPQTVNAYYNPFNNEIVFPAAILQPPFFNFKADAAVNFGGIGAVIGHEISHGFDNYGSKFDFEGNQKDWWTKEDREKFDALGDKLVAQYENYKPLEDKGNDIHVNGRATLGENIADLGGTSIAFDGLKLYLKDKKIDENKKIDGFTQPQRFYISWATICRAKMRDDALIDHIKTDVHSPGMIRATASLVNQEGFYKAFNIKEGDKMYKNPKDRIKIW